VLNLQAALTCRRRFEAARGVRPEALHENTGVPFNPHNFAVERTRFARHSPRRWADKSLTNRR
jgi:hypothetical protein